MRSGWGIPWANYSLEGRKRKIEDVLVKGFNGVYSGVEIYNMLYDMKHIMSGDQLMRFGDLSGDTQAFTLGMLRREREMTLANEEEE